MTAGRTLAASAGTMFFLVCFAASAVVLAPATLLDAALARATDQRVRLAAAEGTFWQGRGTLTTANGHARTSIMWHFDCRAILLAAIAGNVSVAGSAPADVRATLDRVEIGPVDISVPAALVAAAAGPYDAYGIAGTVAASSAGLTAARTGAAGSAGIEWRRAGTAVLDVSPLGTYRATVSLHADGGRFDVQTREGPLVVNGAGQWNAGGVAVTLDARSTGPQSERLTGWLRTMAPEQPDGRFRFVWPPPQRPGARS